MKEILFGLIAPGDTVKIRGRWRRVTGRGDFGRLYLKPMPDEPELPVAAYQDEATEIMLDAH